MINEPRPGSYTSPYDDEMNKKESITIFLIDDRDHDEDGQKRSLSPFEQQILDLNCLTACLPPNNNNNNYVEILIVI